MRSVRPAHGLDPAEHELARRVDEVLRRAQRLLGPLAADQRRTARRRPPTRSAAPSAKYVDHEPSSGATTPSMLQTVRGARRPDGVPRAATTAAPARSAARWAWDELLPRLGRELRGQQLGVGTAEQLDDARRHGSSRDRADGPPAARAAGASGRPLPVPPSCDPSSPVSNTCSIPSSLSVRHVAWPHGRPRPLRPTQSSLAPTTHTLRARALWPTGPCRSPRAPSSWPRPRRPGRRDGAGQRRAQLLPRPRRPHAAEFEYMQQMAAVIDRVGDRRRAARRRAPRRRRLRARPGRRRRAARVAAAGGRARRRAAGARPRLVRPAALTRAADPRGRRARRAARRCRTRRADVVVRDVFAGDTTPDHVRTRRDGRRRWRGCCVPAGVYLANCADRPPLAGARAEGATLREAFADVAVIAEPGLLRGRRLRQRRARRRPTTPTSSGSAALARAVRSLPAPARLLHGDRGHRLRAGTPRRRSDPSARPRHDEGPHPGRVRPFARASDQIGRTLSAWGPLAPCVISNSTRWPSSRLR